MIISRTPFRISFFGGGTDYPAWFQEHGGSVLSTTINKYCHISCRYLPPFFDYKHRIVWSRVEMVSGVDEIQHPSVRECMRHLKIHAGLEIHHDGDLPARAGLGSSSAFTVGMLHALRGLSDERPGQFALAKEAIYVEQKLLRENVGCQDQIAVALGGLNRIDFATDGAFTAEKIGMDEERLDAFQKHLILIFTGVSRTASDIAGEKIKAFASRQSELKAMQEMVAEATKILLGAGPLETFGKLLDESWQLKRRLTERVSNSHVDALYERALHAGAVGGKLLGAGGGGFMLIFAAPERHPAILKALGNFLDVPFRFETKGTHIIFQEESAVPATT